MKYFELIQKTLIRLLVLVSLWYMYIGVMWTVGDNGWSLVVIIWIFLYLIAAGGLMFLHPIGRWASTAYMILVLYQAMTLVRMNLDNPYTSEMMRKAIVFEMRENFFTLGNISLIVFAIYLWLPTTTRLFRGKTR